MPAPHDETGYEHNLHMPQSDATAWLIFVVMYAGYMQKK